MAINTGYKIVRYLDDNPDSPTFGEIYEETVQDLEHCPVPSDNPVLISSECEITLTGRTGYLLNTYYNESTGQFTYERVLDDDCEPSSQEEEWVISGDSYCETTELGVNTGYLVQTMVQMNSNLPNFKEVKLVKTLSPDCSNNACAMWSDISQTCHISVANCNATFDGTADVTQIDINPLSTTYNETRTINIESTATCENCSDTVFSWESVGTLCGDASLLCENGLQNVATNSYTVSQKYKTIGDSTPVPMGEYQIVLNIENDENCGYIPPRYEWRVVPGEFICDYENHIKYEMTMLWVSYDNGETWAVKENPRETSSGDVIAYDSYDCGMPMYRWTETGEHTCVDNGDDWKLKIVRAESDDVVIPCNESSVLTNTEIESLENISDATLIDFGDCINSIQCTINSLSTAYSNMPSLQFGEYIESINPSGGTLINTGYILIENDTFKEGLKVIGNDAFSKYMKYEDNTLYLPSTLESIGSNNFREIKAIVMNCQTPPEKGSNSLTPYCEVLIVPSGAVQTYRTTWTNIAEKTFSLAEENVFFRATYNGSVVGWNFSGEEMNGVLSREMTTAPFKDYEYSAVTDVYISSQVTEIEEGAFSGFTSLSSITISNSVATIGNNAFDRCTSLTSITIPDSVTSIGNGAFTYCSNLVSATINNGDIGSEAFQYCTSLATINLGEGVTSIGERAFSQCSGLTSVTIPDSVTSIGEHAFDSCSGLTSVVISNSVTSIEQAAFGTCTSLSSVTIPNSVTSIGNSAFYRCYSLSSITIPDSVTSIGGNAFNYCTSLTSVTIGNSVTNIGGRVFSYCSSLTSITCNAATAPTISSYTFYGMNTFYQTLIVPNGSTGYDVWMGTDAYYLGYYQWTKVEQ